MKILILSTDNFEDSELQVPYERLQEEGYEVEVASLRPGTITGKHGHTVAVNLGIDDVRSADYVALLLPGGKAPAVLRHNSKVLEVVREFMRAGKPVSAICHGPQILASAGMLRNRAATGAASVADELKAAGARYRDAEVVVDGNLVTSRKPADLPAFLRETLKRLQNMRNRPTQAAS